MKITALVVGTLQSLVTDIHFNVLLSTWQEITLHLVLTSCTKYTQFLWTDPLPSFSMLLPAHCIRKPTMSLSLLEWPLSQAASPETRVIALAGLEQHADLQGRHVICNLTTIIKPSMFDHLESANCCNQVCVVTKVPMLV